MKDGKEYSLENGYMSIHELLAKNGINQRKLINQIDIEEKIENRETYDMIKADIKANTLKTNKNKHDFIHEMKTGLGNSIKGNPNGVIFIKQSKWAKFVNFIKRIFTKF